jgi:hypothetical protein
MKGGRGGIGYAGRTDSSARGKQTGGLIWIFPHSFYSENENEKKMVWRRIKKQN